MDLSGSMQGAGGVGGLLSVNDGTASHYPTYDGNGNVSEYVDTSATIVAHYEYDSFGNTTTAAGAKKDDFAHRFSTKPIEDETGFYYYGYRYYNPVTGTWPSRDPIREWGGLNLYNFVRNNGIRWIDYLGLLHQPPRIPSTPSRPNVPEGFPDDIDIPGPPRPDPDPPIIPPNDCNDDFGEGGGF